jgi:hypothetical protein
MIRKGGNRLSIVTSAKRLRGDHAQSRNLERMRSGDEYFTDVLSIYRTRTLPETAGFFALPGG